MKGPLQHPVVPFYSVALLAIRSGIVVESTDEFPNLMHNWNKSSVVSIQSFLHSRNRHSYSTLRSTQDGGVPRLTYVLIGPTLIGAMSLTSWAFNTSSLTNKCVMPCLYKIQHVMHVSNASLKSLKILEFWKAVFLVLSHVSQTFPKYLGWGLWVAIWFTVQRNDNSAFSVCILFILCPALTNFNIVIAWLSMSVIKIEKTPQTTQTTTPPGTMEICKWCCVYRWVSLVCLIFFFLKFISVFFFILIMIHRYSCVLVLEFKKKRSGIWLLWFMVRSQRCLNRLPSWPRFVQYSKSQY